MAIIHEAPTVNLRFVQKSSDGPYTLQIGHWAEDTDNKTYLLVWEDVRQIPWQLYEKDEAKF